MSADGSRAGFLLGILAEVDRLIGTDYHDQYARATITVERLMVRVGIILSTHVVGMLVIEEIQAENFGNSKHIKEMLLFFLRILNFGIPVVLIGNPLGFMSLGRHTQVTRRLTSGGSFWLHPFESTDELDWQQSLLPGTWEFDVMPQSAPLCKEMRTKIYEYSGGINDFVMRLRADSMRSALHAGRGRITPQDLDRAFKGSKFVENYNLIRGFATKNINLLTLCVDVPVEYYRKLWLSQSKEDGKSAKNVPDEVCETESAQAGEVASDTKKPPRNDKAAQFKSAQTREANRNAQVRHLNATLPDEDMRRSGAKAALIKELKQVKEKLKGS